MYNCVYFIIFFFFFFSLKFVACFPLHHYANTQNYFRDQSILYQKAELCFVKRDLLKTGMRKKNAIEVAANSYTHTQIKFNFV